MNRLKYILFLLIPVLFTGCEKDITLDLPQAAEKLVVEGHIEQGQFPYVLLSHNTSFFNSSSGSFTDYFVHDAIVKITDEGTDYVLDEYCLDDLPDPLKPLVYAFLGITEEQAIGLELCAYINFVLEGQIGHTYRLSVDLKEHHLTSLTTIPGLPKIDSLWFQPHQVYGDSLVFLWGQFDEPDTLGNYYRFFTKTNSEPFYPGYFGSVIDDNFINGKKFRTTIDKGIPRNASIDFPTFGLFRKGDTVVVNISMIDKSHFQFWNSLDEQLNSGGPYASPTYIQSNINGGLGIWGGYAAAYDTIYIPK